MAAVCVAAVGGRQQGRPEAQQQTDRHAIHPTPISDLVYVHISITIVISVNYSTARLLRRE
jgi:hypothetical protein